MRTLHKRSLVPAALGLILVAWAFGGCADTTRPAGEGDAPPSPFAVTVDALKAELKQSLARASVHPGDGSAAGSWVQALDPGAMHNDILAAFEKLHDVSRPLSRDGFVSAYIAACDRVLPTYGITYTVTPAMVHRFLDLFEAAYGAHGLSAPHGVLEDMAREGLITGAERRDLELALAGGPIISPGPPVSYGTRVREASHAYWQSTGRLSGAPGPGTEGWLRDLFVVGSDAVGGVLGGVLGASTGTIVGGPGGGTLGAAIGGPLGAGAFSGAAIMVLECVCSEG